MKKVLTVHISNELFQMEEDGYTIIQKVLRKIDDGSAKSQSLVKEIEERIAKISREKFPK